MSPRFSPGAVAQLGLAKERLRPAETKTVRLSQGRAWKVGGLDW